MTDVLRKALEPFAAIKMGDDADCKTEIVPNGYSDPRDWRNHIKQARAALTQPEPAVQQATDPDVMIGQFIAQYNEGAAGCLMETDDAQALAREFERMQGLIYCPGVLRCAKCDFRLIKTTLTPAGAFANEEPDTCPNCNVPMWRVTWQDETKEAYRTAESQMDRAIEAEKALPAQQAAGEAEAVAWMYRRYDGYVDVRTDRLPARMPPWDDKWTETALGPITQPTETQRIVAWLRDLFGNHEKPFGLVEDYGSRWALKHAADAIEAGEHLAGERQ